MPDASSAFTSALAADVVALLAIASLWGGMLFFAAIYAPLVFVKLPGEVAGQFIRQVFPVYYLAMGAAALVAAAALALGRALGSAETLAMAAVAIGFGLARQVLMPAINAARDAELAGDATAGPRFARLHRLSVVVNGVQLLVVAVVLARFVWS